MAVTERRSTRSEHRTRDGLRLLLFFAASAIVVIDVLH
jgi:hypothetical protein